MAAMRRGLCGLSVSSQASVRDRQAGSWSLTWVLPPGKDQRSGGEIDLMMSFHHQNLERWLIPQQENGGGRNDQCALGLIAHGRIPGAYSTSGSSMGAASCPITVMPLPSLEFHMPNAK